MMTGRTKMVAILVAGCFSGLAGCAKEPKYESCPMSPNIISMCEELANLQEGAPETAGTCVVSDHPQCLADACMLFDNQSFCTDRCEPGNPQPMPASGCDLQQGLRPIARSRFITEFPAEAEDAEQQLAAACTSCNAEQKCEHVALETSVQGQVSRVERVFCTWSECAQRDEECQPGIECIESQDCPEQGKCALYLFDLQQRIDLYYCIKRELAMPSQQ